MFQTIILVIFVIACVIACSFPTIKEWSVKNKLKTEDLFVSLEEDMSYEEVCEIVGCECVEKTKVKAGFKRKYDRCIWDFDPINGKVYRLVVDFEEDLLSFKDIIVKE